MVEQQRREQQRQVPDREAEGLPRQRVAVAAPEAEGVVHEAQAEDQRRSQVDPAAHAVHEGQQRGGKQHHGVEQDLQPRELGAVRHRQHRQAGLAVVVGAVQRQGPEVRWRPQEDDQAQDHRLGADLARHRGPAQHGRHRPRSPADDDVLRRQRLQHHGVHHRVADEGGEGEPHGERIDEKIQNRKPSAT